jgi:hypothetical protein
MSVLILMRAVCPDCGSPGSAQVLELSRQRGGCFEVAASIVPIRPHSWAGKGMRFPSLAKPPRQFLTLRNGHMTS